RGGPGPGHAGQVPQQRGRHDQGDGGGEGRLAAVVGAEHEADGAEEGDEAGGTVALRPQRPAQLDDPERHGEGHQHRRRTGAAAAAMRSPAADGCPVSRAASAGRRRSTSDHTSRSSPRARSARPVRSIVAPTSTTSAPPDPSSGPTSLPASSAGSAPAPASSGGSAHWRGSAPPPAPVVAAAPPAPRSRLGRPPPARRSASSSSYRSATPTPREALRE